MLFLDQFIGLFIDVIDPVLLVSEVLLELVEFLLQHLDVLEILPELVRRHERLLVADPEHDLVALAHELYETQGLLQLEALLLQLPEQQVPQTVQLLQTLLLPRTTDKKH